MSFLHFPQVCYLVLLNSFFFFLFSAVFLCLSCIHSFIHFLPPPPHTHTRYLDPAAGASGDTRDTTGPRSGPSSHPELILHSRSPGQSLIPPPTSGGRNCWKLGSHAACSKQMPACKDSHQSSHTEADCAGSLFHSNKGTSAEQRRVQTEPHGPKGRLEMWGRKGGEARFEVVLGMKTHGEGHVLNFTPGSSTILFPFLPHRGKWLFQ